MAKSSQFVIFSLLFFSAIISVISEDESFIRTVDHESLGLKRQKLSHLHFYWHDRLSGIDPTSITVARPESNPSAVFDFGYLNIFDNPITVGPELGSKTLGRSQGFYADSSQSTESFQVLFSAMNVAFSVGKYNGSTLTILGRNPIILGTVREMPVIGGTGLFKFANGYAYLHSQWFDPATRDAIVEYDVYVWHYDDAVSDAIVSCFSTY